METLKLVYIIINALMYLVFGVWCAADPQFTSGAVGIGFNGLKGLAEYTAVYGGLEFGIGVFYLMAVFRAELRPSVLLFSLCLYGGLALFRTFSLIQNGSDIQNGWYFYGTEVVFSLIAFAFQM